MRKKICIGVITFLLVFVGCYFMFNAVRYSNIVKIEASVINSSILTNKKDIKEFMKYVNTKKRIKEPIFIVNTTGEAIDNNVIVYYKNGKSSSFLMGMDYVHTELHVSSDGNSMVGYKINKENTEKILELLNKNE